MKVCKKALGICSRDGYYSIQTNCVEIRIWFLTDSIIRIRAGFDGDFKEGSYSLVMTAWEDPMDDLMKDYRKRIDPFHRYRCSDSSLRTGSEPSKSLECGTSGTLYAYG